GGAVQRAGDVQQGGLARAGGADNGDEFIAADAQVHLVQRLEVSRMDAGQPAQADQFRMRCHQGTLACMPSVRPSPLTSTMPSANRPVCTCTSRADPPSTTSSPKPPPGSATSAVTGTASTSSR